MEKSSRKEFTYEKIFLVIKHIMEKSDGRLSRGRYDKFVPIYPKRDRFDPIGIIWSSQRIQKKYENEIYGNSAEPEWEPNTVQIETSPSFHIQHKHETWIRRSVFWSIHRIRAALGFGEMWRNQTDRFEPTPVQRKNYKNKETGELLPSCERAFSLSLSLPLSIFDLVAAAEFRGFCVSSHISLSLTSRPLSISIRLPTGEGCCCPWLSRLLRRAFFSKSNSKVVTGRSLFLSLGASFILSCLSSSDLGFGNRCGCERSCLCLMVVRGGGGGACSLFLRSL